MAVQCLTLNKTIVSFACMLTYADIYNYYDLSVVMINSSFYPKAKPKAKAKPRLRITNSYAR